MKYDIHHVCLAVTIMFTEMALTEPTNYTNGEWNAIADVLEVMNATGARAEEENKKESIINYAPSMN